MASGIEKWRCKDHEIVFVNAGGNIYGDAEFGEGQEGNYYESM